MVVVGSCEGSFLVLSIKPSSKPSNRKGIARMKHKCRPVMVRPTARVNPTVMPVSKRVMVW